MLAGKELNSAINYHFCVVYDILKYSYSLLLDTISDSDDVFKV